LNEADWRASYKQVSLIDSPLHETASVTRSGIQAVVSSDGRLQRVLRSEPGRVSTCFIGDDETAHLAYDLDTCLPAEGEWASVKRVISYSRLGSETAQRVLHVMWDYGLIGIRSQAGEKTAHV